MKQFIPFLFGLILLIPACNKTNYMQPELGKRSVTLVEKNGYQFKDLNKNDKLDKYEDYLVHKIADLLYLSHHDVMRLKNEVTGGL